VSGLKCVIGDFVDHIYPIVLEIMDTTESAICLLHTS